MKEWIEIYNNDNYQRNITIHRKSNIIIVQKGESITMIVYKSENDAIFASLDMLVFYNEKNNNWYVDD